MNILPITFAFNSDNTFVIQLEAEVQLPDSLPHYQIKNIHLVRNHYKGSVMPDIVLKCMEKQDKRIWVHIDSNMPSDLSIAVGNALENILPAIEIASASDAMEDDTLSPA